MDSHASSCGGGKVIKCSKDLVYKYEMAFSGAGLNKYIKINTPWVRGYIVVVQ